MRETVEQRKYGQDVHCHRWETEKVENANETCLKQWMVIKKKKKEFIREEFGKQKDEAHEGRNDGVLPPALSYTYLH